MKLVGAAQNSTYINLGPLKLRVDISAEIDTTAVTSGRLAITDRYIGRVDGTTAINSAFSVDRSLTGQADSSTIIQTKMKQRRDTSVLPATDGIQAYAVFFPPWDFTYYDQEPGAFTTSDVEIKGLVTGTKQLGSMLQVGFVNEEVDIRWFGATDPVDDWGDGHHEVPGTFKHTYTTAGLYWMKATATTTSFVTGEGTTGTFSCANAARLIKIINRVAPGQDFSTAPGGTIGATSKVWEQTAPYDVILTSATEGSVDGAFGMQFGILAEGNFRSDGHVGKLPVQTGVLVFIESFENGVQLPGLKIVGGGFTTQRTMTFDPNTGFLTAIAFDPMFWLNQQIMRDQYYENLNMLAATGLAQTVATILKDTVDNCGNHTQTTEQDPYSYNVDISVPALDIALLGYVPEHYLPTLRPDMAAAHIIQHVRVTIPDLPPGLMLNYLEPSTYGNLGQFANFYVSPDFSEKVALGGFHSFSVSTGPVLQNIRQLLENQGAVFHSRSDLTFVLDYKPYYKDTLPSASFDIAVPDALSPLVLTEGNSKNLFKVQIQKPILGLTLPNVTLPDSSTAPVNPATGQPASLNDMGVLFASRAYINGLAGVSAAAWSEWYKQVAMPLYQAAGSPQTVDINNWNFYNDSLDPRNFLWEVQVGDPGGATLGPIQNVFTDDLNKFAIGIAREYVAHNQIVLPLGNVPEINLGDIVLITARHPAMTIDWRKKAFWVTNIRIILDPQGQHTREVTLIEVRPPEVIVYVPDAGGHPTPVPIVPQTDF